MTNGLASSLSYIPAVPASSLAPIRGIATVVRKRKGLNNINRPMPECFSVEGSNCCLTFRDLWHFHKSVSPRLPATNILIVHNGYRYHFSESHEFLSQFLLSYLKRQVPHIDIHIAHLSLVIGLDPGSCLLLIPELIAFWSYEYILHVLSRNK